MYSVYRLYVVYMLIRSVQCDMRHLSNPHRGILDGDLLWKFFHLSLTERKDVARRIGTSVEQVGVCVQVRMHACVRTTGFHYSFYKNIDVLDPSCIDIQNSAILLSMLLF